jgi:hypothetical protein
MTKAVSGAFAGLMVSLLIPICFTGFMMFEFFDQLALGLIPQFALPIPFELDIYRIWFFAGPAFLVIGIVLLGLASKAKKTMGRKAFDGVNVLTIALIAFEGTVVALSLYPWTLSEYRGIPGTWIITPLFYEDWRLGAIALIAAPAAGIIMGIVFSSALKKGGYVDGAVPADFHASLLKNWGKGVPIPIQEISREFDMNTSEVVKMVTTWAKKGIRLKIDPVGNTVVLED